MTAETDWQKEPEKLQGEPQLALALLHEARLALQAVSERANTLEAASQPAGPAKVAHQLNEDYFHRMADTMPQLVWTARPDGQIDYINQRYLEFSGFIRQEDQTWGWGDLLHPEDLEPTQQTWAEAQQAGTVYQIEHRMRLADGSYHWFLTRGIPAKDESGLVVRWYGTATDIHETKMAQQALLEAEHRLADYAHRLEQSNKDLEDFAFIASHDLQEPLQKVRRFGDILRREFGEGMDEKARDYLERMLAAAARMENMQESLLAYSRLNTRAKPFAQVNLQAVVQEVLSTLEHRIQESGAQVEVGELPTLEAEPYQMYQLFQNLISNALKYQREEAPPVIRVSARLGKGFPAPSRETVEISVQDNGIGFEREHAERIFQPFFRLHGRLEYEGSGIGLAICRKIVDRHKGRLWATSVVGQGSTFTIALPVKQ